VLLFPPMPDASTPQFNTAEYAEAPRTDRCHFCQQAIGARYYRVNNVMACPACTEKAALAVPQDDHANFMRALLFGVGAAVAGLALYATVEIATGWIIGYVSLAVGWMVGKAVMAGSNGQGGRRYQIAAVLLTYAAVSMAAIPVIISHSVERRDSHQAQTEKPSSPDGGSGQLDQPRARPSMNLGAALAQLALLGLASPFLELQDPLHGLLGLFILSIGIRIAWQITAGTAGRASGILGPFSSSPPASA
jgi:hypothetical protein